MKTRNKDSLKKKKEQTDECTEFIVYTDGSADNINEPHYAASAFVILDGSTKEILHKFSCGYVHLTNNQAELNAIILAVKELPENSSCCIYTDSQYCIHVLGNTKKTFNKNTEYIDEFRYAVKTKKLKFRFEWVRGHGNDELNNLVDKMASDAFVEIGGTKIDFKGFKKSNEDRHKDIQVSKYIKACIEVASDYIPYANMDSFQKDITKALKEL